MAVIPAASAMDAAGNMGGIRPDGIYFIRDGELKFYPWDQLGGGGGTAGNGLPAGGNIGDVLVKTGAADYAAGWAPQAGLEMHSYEMTLSPDTTTLSVAIPSDIFSAGKLFLLDGVTDGYHVFSTIMTGDSLEEKNQFFTKSGDLYGFIGNVSEAGDNVNVSLVWDTTKSLDGNFLTSSFPSDLTATMHVLSAAVATQGPQGERGAPGAQGPAGQGVPAGGTKGQLLAKTGPADYETAWEDAPAGGSWAVNRRSVASDISANWTDNSTYWRYYRSITLEESDVPPQEAAAELFYCPSDSHTAIFFNLEVLRPGYGQSDFMTSGIFVVNDADGGAYPVLVHIGRGRHAITHAPILTVDVWLYKNVYPDTPPLTYFSLFHGWYGDENATETADT